MLVKCESFLSLVYCRILSPFFLKSSSISQDEIPVRKLPTNQRMASHGPGLESGDIDNIN